MITNYHGAYAYHEGVPRSGNPFDKNSDDFQKWDDQWHLASLPLCTISFDYENEADDIAEDCQYG